MPNTIVSIEKRRASPASDARPSAPWPLVCLSLCVLLSSLDTSIANAGLPTLARAFEASFQAVQWIVLSYLLAVTTLVVGVGRLGDVLGRRRLLLAGIALFTLASAAAGTAPTLWLLIAARAAQGVGAAVMTALTLAFAGDAAPKARTGSAMGLLGTMSATGTALGPSLGGVLAAAFGWRSIFLVNVPLGVAALLLARRHLPADLSQGTSVRAGFGHAGTLLLALTLGAYALAMTPGRGSFGAPNAALLAGAALGAWLFVRTETRAGSPLVRPGTLREPSLAAGLTASALVSTVMMATLVVGPFHLSRALGLRPTLVGLVLSIGPSVAALSGIPAGRLVDRLGARRTALAGLAAIAGACLLLAVLPLALGISGYAGPIVVATAGYALFQAANNTGVVMGARPEHRGVVSGMLGLSRNLGLVTGAAAMGAVFAFASGTSNFAVAPPAAVAAGTRTTFAVAAALITLALAISALGGAAAGSARREDR